MGRSVAPSADNSNDYALTLRQLRLVDPIKVPWEKLLEFRKDKQSMSDLRDFRLLFSEELGGKPLSYVEDRISAGIERHETSAKRWGFDICERAFSIIGSKENIGTTALATGATLATGAPLPMIAASGLLVSIATCGLEIAKVVREQSDQARGPYSYLSNLKRLGED